MRAEAEEAYARRIGDIAPAIDKMAGGFARDDGASVRKASWRENPFSTIVGSNIALNRPTKVFEARC